METLLAPHTIVKLAQLPATFIATVIPVLIVTGCAAVGVVAEPATPPEVVAQIGPFQLPEATANRCPNTLLKKNKLARNKVTTKIVDFKITKIEDITDKLIPFFDKYKIVGVKSLDYQGFKEVSLLMKSGAHLTREGLEKIRLIKAGMNRGRK